MLAVLPVRWMQRVLVHRHSKPISGPSFGGDDAVLWRDCTQLAPQSKDKNIDAPIGHTSGNPDAFKERFPCQYSFRCVKKHERRRV
jgi:hypothetical protein